MEIHHCFHCLVLDRKLTSELIGTPKLKSLSYQVNQTTISSDLFISALNEVKEIEQLTAGFGSDARSLETRLDVTGDGCDLSSFSKLSRLTVPFELLIPQDMFPHPMPGIESLLPESIVTLWLTQPTARSYSWNCTRKLQIVVDWLEKDERRQLNLLELQVDLHTGGFQLIEIVPTSGELARYRILKRIEAACQRSGIFFGLENWQVVTIQDHEWFGKLFVRLTREPKC